VGDLMAHLGALMDSLGQALETVPTLRVFPYYVDSVSPPAAIVGWPDTYDYDKTMGRGADALTFPVVVVVGRADARSTRDRLSQFADGTGVYSIKAAVDGYDSSVYDSARVTKAEFGTVSIAGTHYLAVTFDVELYAPGVS
jgi:hypothetical protein